MVLDVIGAAVLMSFGILAIYFAIDSDAKDSKFLLILLLLGLFLIVEFPDVTQYQIEGFSRAGVFFGIIFFIIGIWLLIFA